MFHNKYMKIAIDHASIALADGEVPISALIVDPQTEQIISKSYNLVEQKYDPTAHAEILAIRSACKILSSKFLSGLDLYVTLQPCMMCLQAAIYAKIRRIYFGAYDLSTSLDLPKSINHNIEIYGGIHELECKDMLNSFFASKR
jgi:tRNA(adenine34) deaminase